MQIKPQLYAWCDAYITQRIQTVQNAITEAQTSADEETKSSAGDKYETGRAMMQLEIEKNATQLEEAMKLKRMLELINPHVSTVHVQPGSLVITSQGNFYLSIGAGQIKLDDKIYLAISPASPIGLKLMNQKTGGLFSFNNREYKIEQVL